MSKKSKPSKAERKAAEKAAAKKAAKKAEREAAKVAEKKARKKAERKAAEKAAAAPKPKGKKKAPTQVETPEQVAERAKPLKGDALKEAMAVDVAAGKERAAQTAAEIDEQIKARLDKKRAARAADQPGSKERLDAVQKSVAEDRAVREKRAEVQTDLDQAIEKLDDLHEARDEIAEHGRELREKYGDSVAAGSTAAPAPVEFAKPSDAALLDFEVNGNKQYVVKRPSDGKEVGYTRVTTYISCLEDTAKLTEWKLRILLEGVAAAEEGGNDAVTARIRDLVHTRDVAIAKARKQDRKGKLVHGQLKTLVDGAFADFKRAMNELAEELHELGGGREAATKGTNIHALCDIAEKEGIAAVNDMLERGEITPSDFADVEAYVEALKRLGAKVTAVEQTIVNHDLKVAGRLDRVVLVKLPQIVNAKGEVIYEGDTRARRYVLDLKTGRVDYSQGKIAQQIRLYAESQAYDLETHETSSHGANRTHGLVLHIAAGSGEARLHIVDLTNGAHGNKLAGEVRAWRNTGKRAIDVTTDVLGQIEAA